MASRSIGAGGDGRRAGSSSPRRRSGSSRHHPGVHLKPDCGHVTEPLLGHDFGDIGLAYGIENPAWSGPWRRRGRELAASRRHMPPGMFCASSAARPCCLGGLGRTAGVWAAFALPHLRPPAGVTSSPMRPVFAFRPGKHGRRRRISAIRPSRASPRGDPLRPRAGPKRDRARAMSKPDDCAICPHCVTAFRDLIRRRRTNFPGA